MNKYLLFMLALQCCGSCMCMKKSAYEKFEINFQDFASKRHELKEYKELLGMLDYTLQDTLIQLSGCETVAQKSQRKQNRNYLDHGEEITATVQHFATESAAKYKETPYKWLPLTNERGIGHAVGKHGILVDPNSGNMTIHNAMNIYKYIQNHGEVKTVYDRMLKFADSANKRNYITRILEYCALIHAIKSSEGYVKHTYKHDIAPETVKSEIKEYEGEKIRVDCTGLAFMVKDLEYNDGSDIYTLFIPVHKAYDIKPECNLMTSVASIYPLSNSTELWYKLNPRINGTRKDDFEIPTKMQLSKEFMMSLPFDVPQVKLQPIIQKKTKSVKKSTKKAKTIKQITRINDLDATLSENPHQQQYHTKYKETGKAGEISLYGHIYKSPFILKINKETTRSDTFRGIQQILDLSNDFAKTSLQRKYLTILASRLQSIYDADIDDEELYTQIALITESINYKGIENPICAMTQISARYGFIRLYAEVFLDDINNDFFRTVANADEIIDTGWKDINHMIATKSSEFKKKYEKAKNIPHTLQRWPWELLVLSGGKIDDNATQLVNNFQAYLERHSILLASLQQELPMLDHSATIISGIQIDEDAWENVKLLKPVYQSTYRRIEQSMLNYNVALNKKSIENLQNLLLEHCDKRPDDTDELYNSDSIKAVFNTKLINEIDVSIKFLLCFMKQIINTQEHNSETKNALNNVSKYADQLYQRLQEAPVK